MALALAMPFLAGCQSKAASLDGAGFAKLTPNAGSRNYIINNDVIFARQVAAHNRTCEQLPACQK